MTYKTYFWKCQKVEVSQTMYVTEYRSHALISLMRNIHEKLLMITVSENIQKIVFLSFY